MSNLKVFGIEQETSWSLDQLDCHTKFLFREIKSYKLIFVKFYHQRIHEGIKFSLIDIQVILEPKDLILRGRGFDSQHSHNFKC